MQEPQQHGAQRDEVPSQPSCAQRLRQSSSSMCFPVPVLCFAHHRKENIEKSLENLCVSNHSQLRVWLPVSIHVLLLNERFSCTNT